jgi:hypothetical protein
MKERQGRALRQRVFRFSADPSPALPGRFQGQEVSTARVAEIVAGPSSENADSVCGSFKAYMRFCSPRWTCHGETGLAMKKEYNFSGEHLCEHTQILVPQTRPRSTFDCERVIARGEAELPLPGS